MLDTSNSSKISMAAASCRRPCSFLGKGVVFVQDSDLKNREECCPIFDPGKALEMLENRSQNHQKSSNINPKVTKNRPNWCPGRSWRGSGEALGRSWGQDAKKEGPKRFPDPPYHDLCKYSRACRHSQSHTKLWQKPGQPL